jgi:hypothetical protein
MLQVGRLAVDDRLDSICPHESENLGNSGEKITENASGI